MALIASRLCYAQMTSVGGGQLAHTRRRRRRRSLLSTDTHDDTRKIHRQYHEQAGGSENRAFVSPIERQFERSNVRIATAVGGARMWRDKRRATRSQSVRQNP